MPFLLECLEKHSICAGKNMVPECLDWNQLILPCPLWRFWRCKNSSDSIDIIYHNISISMYLYISIHMHMYVSLLVDSALHGRTMFKSTCCTTRLWTIWRTCVSVTILSSSTHRNVWLCGWQSTNDKLVFWVILGAESWWPPQTTSEALLKYGWTWGGEKQPEAVQFGDAAPGLCTRNDDLLCCRRRSEIGRLPTIRSGSLGQTLQVNHPGYWWYAWLYAPAASKYCSVTVFLYHPHY